MDAIYAYTTQVKILASKILKVMAKALEVKEDMKTLFDKGMQA